jgi:hypothetical protein
MSREAEETVVIRSYSLAGERGRVREACNVNPSRPTRSEGPPPKQTAAAAIQIDPLSPGSRGLCFRLVP